MLKLRRIDRIGALAGALLLAAFAPGVASAGDRAGVLQCRLVSGAGGILIENQTLDCAFQDDDEGLRPVHYVGRLTKVGANININGQSEFVWGVGAATNHIGPGALAGDYAGPGVGAKLGVGGGGAILVGGSDNTFSLQPFAFEAGTGLGVTAGIESLSLSYVPHHPAPYFRRHYGHRHHRHHYRYG
jgi:hypothetical protein